MWNTIASLLLLCGAASAAERVEASEPHMGTLFRIVVYADDPGRAHTAVRAAFDRVAQLDNALSDYRPNSELNRACRKAAGGGVAISEDLYFVLQKAQSLADRTAGAFDISVGPLSRLWRAARLAQKRPSVCELSAAMQLTGYRKLHLGDRTLKVDSPGMQLDLGAIAKGYAADEGLRILRERGYPQALVAASGDIALGDPPPAKAGWEIGVDSLNPSNERFTRVLQLHNTAVSTSGDTEQFVEIDGVRYSHILDPATGEGLTHQIGVTVISRWGIDADSLATAASVVTERSGPAQALALIKNSGSTGVIVMKQAGMLTEFESALSTRQ